jgi:hypothetical protein
MKTAHISRESGRLKPTVSVDDAARIFFQWALLPADFNGQQISRSRADWVATAIGSPVDARPSC